MTDPYKSGHDAETTGEMLTSAKKKRTRTAVLLILPVILILAAVLIYTGTMDHKYQQQIALGDKYFNEENYEQAEIEYGAAVSLRERKVEARERFALTKAVRGDFPGAAEEYEELYDMTQDEDYLEAIRMTEQEEIPWFIVDPRTQPPGGSDDPGTQPGDDDSDGPDAQGGDGDSVNQPFTELPEEDFPAFFGGELTKQDMESVLNMLFGDLDWQTLGEADIDRIYSSGLMFVLADLMGPEAADDTEYVDQGYRYTFGIDRINRRLAPVTDFRYEPNRDYAGAGDTYVFSEYTDDDNVYIEVRATGIFSNYYSQITSAEYNDREAVLYFTFDEWTEADGYTGNTGSGEARFTRRDDGIYKLTTVTIDE